MLNCAPTFTIENNAQAARSYPPHACPCNAKRNKTMLATGTSVSAILPEQVIALLERLPYPLKIALLLVASTGVRISECLAFRWSHVEWNESKIRIEQAFRHGEIQKRTKTLASKAPVLMCGALAAYLAEWRQQTPCTTRMRILSLPHRR
jgi:integrase